VVKYLYSYLPSLFSLFIIFISPLLSGYLEHLIRNLGPSSWLGEGQAKDERIKVVRYVALDWANRTSFVQATVAAGISWFVLAMNAPGSLLALSGVLLAAVALLGLFLMLNYDGGDLIASTETKFRRWTINKQPYKLLVFALVIINVILILSIFYTQMTVSQPHQQTHPAVWTYPASVDTFPSRSILFS
jgi:hypothetical protein